MTGIQGLAFIWTPDFLQVVLNAQSIFLVNNLVGY